MAGDADVQRYGSGGMSTINPTFHGEVQLAGWSETHTGGCKVTFWLQSSEELDAFRALTVRKGNTAGHRFAAVLVEIGEDEQPVVQPEPEKPKGGALAKLAGMLCDDPNFWQFLTHHFSTEEACESPDNAAEIIREVCEIPSRSELDWNTDAANRFQASIRRPWLKWRDERGLK
jgi:hypothetical protein